MTLIGIAGHDAAAACFGIAGVTTNNKHFEPFGRLGGGCAGYNARERQRRENTSMCEKPAAGEGRHEVCAV
jgi:hypothetical protein